MNNLPVYSDIRNGNTKVVTVVRKYTGDVHALGKELQRLCNSDVTLYHGRLEVKGIHVKEIKEWLAGLDF
jgi:large subunit ribosomal protein L49